MSEDEFTGGEQLDAPNKQAVGLDPPWVEGTGGEGGDGGQSDNLDAMTKDELLAYASDHGIEGVSVSDTKADIRAAIDQAGK